jgi:hypothetical protein
MATIVRLDKVKASYNGNLENVKHSAVLENGRLFHLGALVVGETELREVRVPAVASFEKDPVVILAHPEIDSDPRKAGLKDFSLPIGKAGRAYHLEVGDIVTLTADAFTATPTVGQYAVVDGNGSLKLAPSTDGKQTIATIVYSPRFVAKVIESTKLGYDGTVAYAIQVEKA